MRKARFLPLILPAALLASGCGGSSSTSSTSSASSASTSAQSGGGAGALSAEAASARTGDIPDTQAFLVYHNQAARYSMRYPEGWAQRGGGNDVTIQDKNNIVHITLRNGPPPIAAAVSAEITRLAATNPTFKAGNPAPFTLTSGPAIKVSYTTQSAPNQVTGKRVTLIVDRYEIAHNGRIATVDLGTAQGVDNKDAYRMMIQSFKWT